MINAGRKPLLMVAPNGARYHKTDHPALPITIAEIAQAAASCQAAGADAIHAHVRDQHGAHTLDVGLYRNLLAAIADATSNMPAQITTESAGQYTAAQQRKLLYDLQPKWASVAITEMLSDGDIKEAARLYHWAAAENILLQHIAYNVNDVIRLRQLIDDDIIPNTAIQILFVLGNYTIDGAPAMLSDFLTAYQTLPSDSSFMVCAFGRQETVCLRAAAMAGGDCRAGFENNHHHPDGQIARDNAERIAEVAIAINQQ